MACPLEMATRQGEVWSASDTVFTLSQCLRGPESGHPLDQEQQPSTGIRSGPDERIDLVPFLVLRQRPGGLLLRVSPRTEMLAPGSPVALNGRGLLGCQS